MKRYLLIGLIILIGTNIVALSGVVFNRMGEETAQLTLTERELSLPYSRAAQKENSGISLTIEWRKLTDSNTSYYAKEMQVSKARLLALGFEQFDNESNYWAQSRELYWALEFDGDLYAAEIKQAKLKYQAALAAYQEQPSESNQRQKKEALESLNREKKSNSRLFFVEVAKDYESLSTKFFERKNVIIVKGLAKPYYNPNKRSYRLTLKQLSVRHLMVPLEHTEVLSGLTRPSRQYIQSPRYAVDVKWGRGLEPWITDVKKVAK